jgi:RNA-splicing ligase RtcB
MITLPGKYTTAKIMIDDIEPGCMAQIIQFINHPVFTNPVAIMPDTHYGKGSVIGFTMPLGEKVIPNVIGVDIGCGMLSVNLGKQSLNYQEIDDKIRENIPFGINIHSRGIFHMKNDFPWKKANIGVEELYDKFQRFQGFRSLPDYDWFMSACKRVGVDLTYAISSIGTLGGGNHFIEFGTSEATGEAWLTVHSGSRNFGKRVCDYWQEKAENVLKEKRNSFFTRAVEEIKKNTTDRKEIGIRIEQARKEAGIGVGVSIRELEWLEDARAVDYLVDMLFSQVYAEVNRQAMVNKIVEIGGFEIRDRIETVHNFVDFRDFIIRKGAIRSYIGEKMIIPFNMRDGILVCEGKSNPEWNFSAPHGAGRLMSRSKAKATLNLETFKTQMEGIFSTSVVNST